MNDYTPSDSRYKVRDDWFRPCGKWGLKLPALALGCWHNFGATGSDTGQHDEQSLHENARQMLFTAFDHGITHFDLANNYGPPPGMAERRVGQILKEDLHKHRDELIISSKAGWQMWPGPYGDFGSRKYIIASCQQSLKRLGLDYVDIFYHHRPDPDTPLEETLGALDYLVKSGKTLYAGISSYSGADTARAIEICEREHLTKPIIHQPSYSIFNRNIETDLLDVTRTLGMGVIAFCPLAQGRLTSKYLQGIPGDSRAASPSVFLNKDGIDDITVSKAHKLNELAQQRNQTLAQMALAWVLRDRRVTTALIGASRPEQIIENIQAFENTKFSEQELAAIDQIAAM